MFGHRTAGWLLFAVIYRSVQASLRGAHASSGFAIAAESVVSLHGEGQATKQAAKLQDGLAALENLKFFFNDNQKFVDPALSKELVGQDYFVWTALNRMIEVAKSTQDGIHGASLVQQTNKLKTLVNDLSTKAGQLPDFTLKYGKTQQDQDEQYLLGLLMTHQFTWPIKKQVSAVATFVKHSPVIAKLYRSHSTDRPLAPQLASLMAEEKASPVAKLFVQIANAIAKFNP
jgi:hypothetical protein